MNRVRTRGFCNRWTSWNVTKTISTRATSVLPISYAPGCFRIWKAQEELSWLLLIFSRYLTIHLGKSMGSVVVQFPISNLFRIHLHHICLVYRDQWSFSQIILVSCLALQIFIRVLFIYFLWQAWQPGCSKQLLRARTLLQNGEKAKFQRQMGAGVLCRSW